MTTTIEVAINSLGIENVVLFAFAFLALILEVKIIVDDTSLYAGLG